MAKMKTGMPTQKVTAAAAAAALASVIVAVFSDAVPGVERFQAELITVVTFLVGYFVPPSTHDEVEAETAAATKAVGAQQ